MSASSTTLRPGTSDSRWRWVIIAKITEASIKAKPLPMQLRGPVAKGR